MKLEDPRKREKDKVKRFAELAYLSESRSAFYFTDFLSPSTAALAYDAIPEHLITAFGGADGCERVILRFGDPAAFGYEEMFPVVCIEIRPTQAKFSDALTHRDYLGALMSLGIERDTIGDVIVRDNTAWLFALPHIGRLICDELYEVRHTSVRAAVIDALPQEADFRFEERELIVPSLRMDALAAKLCHLSRGKAKELFASGQILLNGRLCTKESTVPRQDDVIVIRGHGKYIFDGAVRQTAKGNTVIRVRYYV